MKKVHRANLRLTERELQKVERIRAQRGLSLSDYFRDLLEADTDD